MVLHPVPSVSRLPAGDELVVVVWVVGIDVVLSVTVDHKLAVVAVAVVVVAVVALAVVAAAVVAAADKDTASILTVLNQAHC